MLNNHVDSSLPNYPAETIRVPRYLKSRRVVLCCDSSSFIMASGGHSVQFGVWLCILGFALAQDQSKYFGSKDDSFNRCQVGDFARVPCGDPGITKC